MAMAVEVDEDLIFITETLKIVELFLNMRLWKRIISAYCAHCNFVCILIYKIS